MIKPGKLKVGDSVYYQPEHYTDDNYENGVVKEIPNHTSSVRVVYNCGGNGVDIKNSLQR